MSKLLTGIFVGVFVGAFGYQMVKKTQVGQKATKKIVDGVDAAKKAFKEGYSSVSGEKAAEQPA